jgi:cold shock CspA family protein
MSLKKEYGIIHESEDDDYFIKSRFLKHNISVGDKVEFDIENSYTKKGLFRASKIKIMEKKKIEVLVGSNSVIGNVKWFNNIRRFGFISKDSSDYFFHIHSIKTNSCSIKENDFVVFEICESKKLKGKKDANNIYVLKDSKYSDSLNKLMLYELAKFKSKKNDKEYNNIKSFLTVYKLLKGDYPNIDEIEIDNECKFLLWIDNYVPNININIVINKLVDFEQVMLFSNKIFSNISNESEQEIVITRIIEIIGVIDTLKNFRKVKRLLEIEKLPELAKAKILKLINTNCNKEFIPILKLQYYECSSNSIKSKLQALLNLTTILRLKPSKNKYSNSTILEMMEYYRRQNNVRYIAKNISLFPLEYQSEIEKLFIVEVWERNYYSRSPIYNEYKSAVKSLIYSIKENEIYNYYSANSIIDFYNEIKGICIYVELKQFFRCTVDPIIFKTIQEYFIHYLLDNLSVINKYLLIDILNIEKNHDKEFFLLKIDKIFEQSTPSNKLLLWLNDLSDKFDYNLYAYYYFTLNVVERSIFNKKAKALMGEKLKQSMLQKCVPWTLINIDEIQNIKKYSATWRSIWFLDQKIKICKDLDANFSESYPCDFSEEKFNLLSDYISGKKLNKLSILSRNNHILKIIGLEELEEIIWKVQIQKEVENGIKRGINISSNKIPTNFIIRNKCIQFFNQLQVKEFQVVRILEKTFNLDSGGFSVDISLLYSIPVNTNYVAIIWESLELEKSKATHIFRCFREEYLDIFNKIEYYLSTKQKVRSSLNSFDSENIQKQQELKHLCRIDHDNFDYLKWERKILEILPDIRKMPVYKGYKQ